MWRSRLSSGASVDKTVKLQLQFYETRRHGLYRLTSKHFSLDNKNADNYGFTSRKPACSPGRAGCGGRDGFVQTSRSSGIENASSKCTFCPGLLSAILVMEAACHWWCASCSFIDLTLAISSANSVPTSFGTWNSVPSSDRRRNMSLVPSRRLSLVESPVCHVS